MENLIAITDICTYHEVEYTFISSLGDAGLISLSVVNDETFIPESDMQILEKMIRMYTDLDINVPGIEAVIHLLRRVEQMQDEIRALKCKLAIQPDITVLEY